MLFVTIILTLQQSLKYRIKRSDENNIFRVRAELGIYSQKYS